MFLSIPFLLCGCSLKQPVQITAEKARTILSEPFSANLIVQTEDVSVEGFFERIGPGIYTFSAAPPSWLEGLSLSFDQQDFTIQYKEMEIKQDPKVFPANFVFSAFNNMLDGMSRRESFVFRNTEDGGAVLSGKVLQNQYELVVDPQGYIRTFSLPEEKTSITILETLIVSKE